MPSSCESNGLIDHFLVRVGEAVKIFRDLSLRHAIGLCNLSVHGLPRFISLVVSCSCKANDSTNGKCKMIMSSVPLVCGELVDNVGLDHVACSQCK